jgi:hypothetical protein
MRQTDLARDMAYGQVAMITATPDQDMREGIDYALGKFYVAYRRRKLSVKTYGQISIRYRRLSGAMTERDKILNGISRFHLYVFEFLDAWVICTMQDIRAALKKGPTQVVANHDGITEALYINIADLPHLMITKEVN